MSEMRRLAKILAVKKIEIEKCHFILHWFGFNGFTVGFAAHLDYLISLEPALKRLEELYPNLKPFILPFTLGRQWKIRLESYLNKRERDFQKKNPYANPIEIQEYVYSRFDTRKPGKDIHGPASFETYRQWSPRSGVIPADIPLFEVNSSDHGPTLLMHASAKVMFHTWRFRSEVFTDEELSHEPWSLVIKEFRLNIPSNGKFDCHDHYHKNIETQIENKDYRKLIAHCDIASVGLEPFADALSNERHSLNKGTRRSPGVYKVINSYQNMIRLLERTQGKNYYSPKLNFKPDSKGSKPKPKTITERRQGAALSCDLTEEELLPEHIFSLDSDDWTQLRPFIEGENPHGTNLPDSLWKYPTWHIKQWGLVLTQLALVTGETLKVAAKTHIFNANHIDFERADFKCLHRSALVTFKNRDNDSEVYWLTRDACDNNICLKTATPFGRRPLVVDAQLHEIIPVNLRNALAQAVDELTNRLDRTEAKCRITIKHTLARLLYIQTVDRAVIEYICGSGKGVKSSVMSEGSLTHYIHSKSPIIQAAYTNAINAILDCSGRPAELDTETWSEKQIYLHITQEQVINTTQKLIAIVTASKNLNHRERHNAFAIYCGYLFLLGFGIREQANILPFSWQLDLEDSLAFICDKPLVGSEARYLPIPLLVKQHFEQYSVHLQNLLDYFDTKDPDLADDVRLSIGMPTKVDRNIYTPKAYLFIFENDKVIPLSTTKVQEEIDKLFAIKSSHEDKGIKAVDEIEGINITGYLRKNVATYVANRTTNGMLVELLLGHNSVMHILGTASSWVPDEAYSELRPILDRYLTSSGAVFFEFASDSDKSIRLKQFVPDFETEYQAYEARLIDSEEATALARMVLKEVLQLDYLNGTKNKEDDDDEVDEIADIEEPINRSNQAEGDNEILLKNGEKVKKKKADVPDRKIRYVKIDEDDVVKIIEAADEILEFHPNAKPKVRLELARLTKESVTGKPFHIEAASLNLVRTIPGPIAITFARHRTIYKKLIAALPSGITRYFKSNTVNGSDRLGALALLLIINDAVLSTRDLKALISAAQSGHYYHFLGQVELNARVETRTRIYNRGVELTIPSISALYGYIYKQDICEVVSWPEIEFKANCILASLNLGIKLNLPQLIECSRAYWFVKLPGWAFSNAKGESPCNGPSPYSVSRLLGGPPASVDVKFTDAVISKGYKRLKELSPERAIYLAITQLTAGTEKAFENHEGRSATMRIGLRECLKAISEIDNSTDDYLLVPHLSTIREKYEVASVLLDFISYLLDVGGPKEEYLGFGTIRQYISRIAEAIIKFALANKKLRFRNYSVIVLDQMYEKVFAAKPESGAAVTTALNIFHDFMRNKYALPPCSRFPSVLRKPTQSRNALPLPQSIDFAIDLVNQKVGAGDTIQEAAGNLLAICGAFGTRRSEAFFSRKNDYRSSTLQLKLKRNSSRDLKTLASRRLTPISLSTKVSQSYISDIHGRTPDGQTKDVKTALFANPKLRNKTLSSSEVFSLSINSLKQVTGDSDVVLHSLRHLYYSRLFLHLFESYPRSKIGETYSLTLKLENSSASQFTNIQLEPKRYPFWVFRLGRWLGHEDESTGLTTYSHVGWTILSGFCHVRVNSTVMPAGMAAALLNRSPRSISTWLDQQPFANTSVEAMRGLIEARIKNDKIIPSIDLVTFSPANLRGPALATPVPKPVGLHMIDTFLCIHRNLKKNLSDSVLHFQKKIGLPIEVPSGWADSYAIAVRINKLADFENPDKNITFWKRLNVTTGQECRRVLLDKIQSQWVLMSIDELKEIESNILYWLNHMNPHKPFIICIGQTEASIFINWLESIGYFKNDLNIHVFEPNSVDTQWCSKNDLLLKKEDVRFHTFQNTSGATPIGIHVESNELLPAGRDFVRSLIGCFLGIQFTISQKMKPSI